MTGSPDHSIPGEVLARFATATATREERRQVLAHLLSGCEVCQASLRRRLPPARRSGNVVDLTAAYGEAIDRAVARALGTFAGRGAGSPEQLAAELAAHPPSRQETLVRNHPRYCSSALLEWLLERSHEARFSDPGRMRHLAQLAVLIAERLASPADPDRQDRRARAWMALANGLRVGGELRGSEAAFEQAAAHLATGTGSPALRARLGSQRASLRFDQRRFEESLSLLAETVAIWRQLHEPAEVARALVQQAIATGEAGRPRAAVHVLLEAGKLVDRLGDPRLALIVLQNTIRFYADAGSYEDALRLYAEARPLFERADPLIRLKVLWVEAQIMAGLGHLEPAAGLFEAARDGMLERGNAYEAGLASLELAGVLARMGRLQEVRLLAASTLATMQACGIDREALAAVILLGRAAERENALTLIRQAVGALRTAPRNR